MALQRPMWVLQYSAASGVMSPLKIVQGGVSNPYLTTSNITHTFSGIARWGCVHQGKPYLPTASGWLTFNPSISKWELVNKSNVLNAVLVSLDKLAYFNGTYFYRWNSPEAVGPDYIVSNVSGQYQVDYVVHNSTIYTSPANPSYQKLVWSYPFTTTYALAGTAVLTRLAVHRGAVYGIQINTAANSRLYKFEGGVWNVQGASGFDVTDKAYLSLTAADRTAFFSWNGKLWMIVAYTGAVATWCYRCFEVGLGGDTITENTAVIPAGMQVPPGAGITRYIWNIEDDAGSARQVFIGLHARAGGTLAVYEFDSEVAAMSLVANTGAQAWTPPLFWDPTCQSCEVLSAQDSSPSEYATIQHRVSDRDANGAVSVDIRYKDCADVTTDPPWAACTDKTGQGEGKTGLSSKPAGIAAATDLSDAFSGTTIDYDRWDWSNQGIQWAAGDLGGIPGAAVQWQPITINDGKLRLGCTTPTPAFTVAAGIGLRSKWLVGSDFSADVEIEIENLTDSVATARRFSLVFMARVAYDQIYGIQVWRETGPVYKCGGFTCSVGTVPSVLAVPVVTLNGNKFRISRTAGVWALTHDPDVAADNLLPPTTPVYTEEVQFYLLLMTENTANPASGTPGPGFRSFTVNSGTLGKYLGTVEHTFAWDHGTDVGAVVNKGFQLYADTD